jgi:hypothetical protein
MASITSIIEVACNELALRARSWLTEAENYGNIKEQKIKKNFDLEKLV